MTRRLLFTVDLDRDVNTEVEGSIAAGSIDRGEGTAPRFFSSERGLGILLDMLDDIGMKATFFVEGRTSEVIDCSSASGHCIGLHGYDHEDLTSVSDPAAILERGFSAVSDSICRPTCFRAPYMRIDDRVYGELERLGIRHDSSVYSGPETRPYKVGNVTEHPVVKGKDRAGKTIAAYLWPMHEGKRVPSDYIDLAHSVGDNDIVLADHSWHMVERRSEGVMDREWIARNLSDTIEILQGIADLGFRPSVIAE